MDLNKIIGAAVISAALIVLLRQYRPEFGVILSVAASGLLFLWIVGSVLPVIQEIWDLAQKAGLPGQDAEVLVKALGICFLTQTASDACKDAGESSLASKVELSGKAAVLILCLPMFQDLLDIALRLILY